MLRYVFNIILIKTLTSYFCTYSNGALVLSLFLHLGIAATGFLERKLPLTRTASL